MRGIKEKGIMSGVLAGIAVVLLVFMINSTIQAQQSNETFLRAQAARETALKTENVIRLLDKATSDGYYDSANLNPGCPATGPMEIAQYFQEVIGNVDEDPSSNKGFECTFTEGPTFNPGAAMEASGEIECSTNINGFKGASTREFNFDKRAEPITNEAGNQIGCRIIDEISGCTEQPNFSCPAA